MPAIKGDMYINTHCNYSQPTLIKLYNENIGGHLTPLQWLLWQLRQGIRGMLSICCTTCIQVLLLTFTPLC